MKKLYEFRIFQIFLTLGNLFVRTSLVYFVGFGIIIASTCSYTTIVGYQERVSLVIYLASQVIASLCVTINTLVLSFVGAPNSDGKHFINKWRVYLMPCNKEKGRYMVSFPEKVAILAPFVTLKRFLDC